MTAERISTRCAKCGQVDDHPKHSFSISGITDPVSGREIEIGIARHMDCCAEDGCGVCATQIGFAGDRRGLDLAEFLQSPSTEHAAALAERHGIDTTGGDA